MRKHRVWIAAVLVLTLSGVAIPAQASDDEARTAEYFHTAVMNTDPTALIQFMTNLPKGADLHNHLSGAVYAENYLNYGAASGACVELDTADAKRYLAAEACTDKLAKTPTLITNVLKDPDLKKKVIDAWSMRGFMAQTEGETGADHFFATFGKFGYIAGQHQAEMLRDVALTAAGENVSYLELMVSLDADSNDGTPDAVSLKSISQDYTWGDPDFYSRLVADARLQAAVSRASQTISRWEEGQRAQLHCDQIPSAPGCNVQIRYISSVARLSSNNLVFTQMVFGMELQRVDPRVVGMTLLQQEYLKDALVDYGDQMTMLKQLNSMPRYSKAHLSLHAGELMLDSGPDVKPIDLTYHINDAVNIAKANRIGHGTDINGEDNKSLPDTMSTRGVMVEINLTSNAQILQMGPGLKHKHPFPLYRQWGVPVALSTDDPGVERTTLSLEYAKAARQYGLSYYDIKEMDRNSLTYSFLPGDSLWAVPGSQVVNACKQDVLGASDPSAECSAFLRGSQKALQQWKLEADLAAFEHQAP